MSQQSLNDQTASPTRRRSTAGRVGLVALWVVAGAVLTAPVMFLAVASAGAGHGHYSFARLFFPIPLLLTLATGDRITDPVVAQFPLYGLLLGVGAAVRRRAFWFTLAGIGLCQGVATTLCFAGLVPNFS